MGNHATYARQSPFTDPGPRSGLLDDLPPSVPEVCALVQALLLHAFEAPLYGVRVPEQQLANVDIEGVSELLTRIVALDDRPLRAARPPNTRLPVCCRQFAGLTCAILRHNGVPSRIRDGFADYLPPDRYVAHSICEYWQPQERRWVRIDPQIDDVQKRAMQIAFDPLDVPAERYLSGAEAWHAVRSARTPAERFEGGLADLRNIVSLDLLALNCLETHAARPTIMARPTEPPSADELGIVDRVVEQILAGQDSLEAIRSIYEAAAEFQIPKKPSKLRILDREKTMEIRPPKEPDVAAVIGLWDDFMTELHGSAPADPDRKNWSARLRRQIGKSQAYVASVDGSLVGFAGVIDHFERDFIPPGVAYLVDLYVVSNQRRHGVASALLDCLAQDASRAGHTEVWTNTSRSNARAQACLTQAGFSPLEGFMLPCLPNELYFRREVTITGNAEPGD